MPAARPQHKGKLAVSYGRAEPVTRKRSAQSSCFQTLIKYFKLYCRHSSMMGLKYLVEDRATWTARILWTVMYGFTVWMVYTYVSTIYREYIHTPITTTPESDYFPTEYNSKVTNFTVNEIISAIQMLGHMYDPYFNGDDDGEAAITEILTRYYGVPYDLAGIMGDLTPRCEDLLVTCAFHNEEKHCMEYFEVRRTHNGFCCTFNYIPGYKQKQGNQEVKLVKRVGLRYGLSVGLNPMLDDYFYSILPITGFKVTIFQPRDYPDVSSGGMSEFLLAPQTRKYVKLRAVGQTSSHTIRSYPLCQRKCLFHDEKRTIFESYSASDCILVCKIDDIWQFCKCKLFFHPQPIGNQAYNRTCIMEDMPCLRRYANKTRYLVPYRDKNLVRLVKKNETLFCHACYPECDDLIYEVSGHINSFQLELDRFYDNITGYTTLDIFFANTNTVYLRQRRSYEWYDYLSDIGGICGFFLGCSLISIVEIIYYFLLFLMELLMPPSEPETEEEAGTPRKQLPMQSLYFNELLPRPRTVQEDF
ncbi:sodium channel protein Nach-like isoform X3 [Nomia melanderi]|uniref:sodium channel protein Nach-like isoform X3 n=1 Tax=Nomia melanderi TaxID=2448451 RepID=UPI003FCCFA68